MISKRNKYIFIISLFLGFLFIALIRFIDSKDSQKEVIKEDVFKTTVIKNGDPLEMEFQPLTNLQEVNESVNSSFEIIPSENTVSIISTGDIMLGRTVNYKTITYNDYTWAFKNIAELLKSADLTFINLENPLVENCPIKNDGMIFCASEKHIEGLLYAEIDVASLGNNHAFNYSSKGINFTKELLNKNKIDTVGTHNLAIKEIKGLKVGFLGYTDIECYAEYVSCVEEEKVRDEILKAKAKTDLVVVMFHWGTEYTHNPNQRQKDFAYLAIDSGADLILGNHPHWYQPLEMYKEKLIIYSHGNTIFDQMWSEKTKEGLIMKSTFDVKSKKLIDVKLYPTYIKDYGQPELIKNKRLNLEKTDILL